MNPEPAWRMRRLVARGLVAALVVTLLTPAVRPEPARAANLPPGFSESVVLSGLTQPTMVRFARDGRVFVAEKRGVIKVFDGLGDSTPETFADLRTEVYNFWDRGLLSIALHPDFPVTPYVYALYTRDAEPGGEAPRWGSPSVDSDPCPTPPGPTADGCLATGRLTRLTASGNVATEVVPLITNWCQQYPSHSVADLAFGADGALYVSAGEGANFYNVDWGQYGSPPNPCGDPPGGVGAELTPPTAEGGALRAQDLRTGGDNVTLDGALLRVDPITGAALPDNPLASRSGANVRRIVAYGFKNPFRIAVRPGTSEVWAGDVGWSLADEIDRVARPTASVRNFGWPCYEGAARQPGYDSADLDICEKLYADAVARQPYFTYRVGQQVADETCSTTAGSSIAGLAFYSRGSRGRYPTDYRGALFFADYSRDCIWVMFKGANGLPDPSTVTAFRNGAANPVGLVIGPRKDLFYVDFNGGTVRRITYTPENQPPQAVIDAQPTEGLTPLTVSFDGSASSDPDGDPLSYAWDLDADGAFDDATTVDPEHTYTQKGTYVVQLRVSDGVGGSDTASFTIRAGGTSPTPTIIAPTESTTWRVGDLLEFEGTATDAEDGTLPRTALTWTLVLHHCPVDKDSCHEHPVQSWTGVRRGSFTAPDHQYPSYLELRLSASDSDGFSATVSHELQPRTVILSFATDPRRFKLIVGSDSARRTPFSQTFIVRSVFTISAPYKQIRDGKTYRFHHWSDGGARTHDVRAPGSPRTYTAYYRR